MTDPGAGVEETFLSVYSKIGSRNAVSWPGFVPLKVEIRGRVDALEVGYIE